MSCGFTQLTYTILPFIAHRRPIYLNILACVVSSLRRLHAKDLLAAFSEKTLQPLIVRQHQPSNWKLRYSLHGADWMLSIQLYAFGQQQLQIHATAYIASCNDCGRQIHHSFRLLCLLNSLRHTTSAYAFK